MAQTIRILLQSNKKIVLTGVTSYTKANVTVYNGNNYRDQEAFQSITAVPILTLTTAAAVTTVSAAVAANTVTLSDEAAHIAPRNEATLITLYQFTTADGVFEIPFVEVQAMYTTEAT